MAPTPERSMRRAKKSSPLRPALGAAVSLGALTLWAVRFGLHDLGQTVAWPLIRTSAVLSLGLLIGQVLEGTGYSAKIGQLVRPLLRWAKLPPQAGASFIAAFVSGITANGLLFAAWQEGRLNRRELILANLLNASLPSFLLHLPTTAFIVASLVGPAGAAYLVITGLAALLRLLAVALTGRLVLSGCPEPCRMETGPQPSWREVWGQTLGKFRARLIRMLLLIVPIYLAVALAARSGLFDRLRDLLAHFAVGSLLPVESMGVVVFALMAEFTSGFAAAGALLSAGTLGFKEAVLALLIGAMLSAPVRALRHQLSHYLAIFTPALGLELMILGQLSRVVSLALLTALFWWLW